MADRLSSQHWCWLGSRWLCWYGTPQESNDNSIKCCPKFVIDGGTPKIWYIHPTSESSGPISKSLQTTELGSQVTLADGLQRSFRFGTSLKKRSDVILQLDQPSWETKKKSPGVYRVTLSSFIIISCRSWRGASHSIESISTMHNSPWWPWWF